jgi:hypothetical protein
MSVRVAETGYHRYVPQSGIGDVAASYGILLRHDHGELSIEPQDLRDKGMMVRERMLDQLDPVLAQRPEESPWIADSRHRVHASGAKVL